MASNIGPRGIEYQGSLIFSSECLPLLWRGLALLLLLHSLASGVEVLQNFLRRFYVRCSRMVHRWLTARRRLTAQVGGRFRFFLPIRLCHVLRLRSGGGGAFL